MTKKFTLLTPFMMLLTLPAVLTSCNDDDDDQPNDTAYYDFSIVWSVVDKGEYSTADAMMVAAELTDACEDLFEACTTAYAINEFNDFCEKLRYEFATDYAEITLKATLVRNEGNKTIASKTFYIHPDGTILKIKSKTETTGVTVE